MIIASLFFIEPYFYVEMSIWSTSAILMVLAGLCPKRINVKSEDDKSSDS